MAKKNSQSKKKGNGVEPFDEDEDDVEDADAEDEEVEDEDDSDDDDSDDEDEDDEDEDEAGLITDIGFAPFIVSEKQDWDIGEIISNADAGDIIYLYAPPELDDDDTPVAPAKWYKLVPVAIGEIMSETPEA